jgi:lipopolysaccharide biosynthesis glycosyltransferase
VVKSVTRQASECAEPGRSAVVLGLDANYVMPASVLLRSMASFLDSHESLDVVILHENLGPRHQIELLTAVDDRRLRLDFRQTALHKDVMPASNHLTRATFLKLIIPYACPFLDRAVYLDADMVALRDVRELLTLPLGGYAVAAVQDPVFPTFGSPHVLQGHPLKQAAPDTPYLNSGLMVMDLVRWRELSIGRESIDIAARRVHSTLFAEQDAVNAVLKGDWLQLDRRWNSLPFRELSGSPEFRAAVRSRGDLRELLTVDVEAYVMHFAGPNKPWHEGWRRGPNHERFMKHLPPRYAAGSRPA